MRQIRIERPTTSKIVLAVDKEKLSGKKEIKMKIYNRYTISKTIHTKISCTTVDIGVPFLFLTFPNEAISVFFL